MGYIVLLTRTWYKPINRSPNEKKNSSFLQKVKIDSEEFLVWADTDQTHRIPMGVEVVGWVEPNRYRDSHR